MQRTSIDKHQSKVMALTLGAKLTHVPKITLSGTRIVSEWWGWHVYRQVVLLPLTVTAVDRETDSITYYTETDAVEGEFDRALIVLPAGQYIVPVTKIYAEEGDEIKFSYEMGF